MTLTTIAQFLVSGLSMATFITVMILLAKMARWTGIVDTRLSHMEETQRIHLSEQHHSHRTQGD